MPKTTPLHRIQQINYLRSLSQILTTFQSEGFNHRTVNNSEPLLSTKIELAIKRLEIAESPQLGPTPRELIWRKNKSRLYRYTSGSGVNSIPLFVMYGLINKPTILDLSEQESFIAFLIQQGFTVYLLDWGSFGPEDSCIGISTLLLHYLPRAIRAMQTVEGHSSYHLLGYCMGGTLAAIWTAYASRHLERTFEPATLALLASPIDFGQSDVIDSWLSSERLNVEAWAHSVGNVPGEWVTWGNMLMRPYENIFLPLKQLILHGEDPDYFGKWLALDSWIHASVYFPKSAFIEWIRCFYQENQLMNGTYRLEQQPIQLNQITIPLIAVIAENDRLVTPAQADPVLTAVSSQTVERLAAQTGHVSLVISTYAKKQVWPRLVRWLEQHS
ncbi:hypothetical protein ACQCN2_07215 [Brevibacillus ginsengisoli]|uniref:hypothetical protein n=1 Tax=Brevibacillus ginsengisoli TaxID=363854 RepID=UPI003CF9B7FE